MASEEFDSIHLCDYPQSQETLIDDALETMVALSRETVRMGRALREKYKLKTRQPLPAVVVVSHSEEVRAALLQQEKIICEELNVKALSLQTDVSALATIKIKPNFKTLGRRFGKNMKTAAQEIGTLGADALNELQAGGTITICDEPISLEDVMVSQEAKGDMVVETAGALTVALDTQLTEALEQEGLVREVISRLQKHRKDSGMEITDRVNVTLRTDSSNLANAVGRFDLHIKEEVLALQLEVNHSQDGFSDNATIDIDGTALLIEMTKA